MSEQETPRSRRERSARYPGVPLAEAIELCRQIDERGLDGLPAGEIAGAMGYKNIKTQTFSAPLSAARQFGLLSLAGDGYALTPLARSVLHPTDPADLPRLRRRAFLTPSLYADLAGRMAGKRVPEASILANVLYHHHQITASAKVPAAEAFLESARFVGLLGPDNILIRAEDAEGPGAGEVARQAPRSDAPPPPALEAASRPPERPASVRLDLHLWGADRGKVLRVRAPDSITPASFERFLQAFRLLVRVEEEPGEVD